MVRKRFDRFGAEPTRDPAWRLEELTAFDQSSSAPVPPLSSPLEMEYREPIASAASTDQAGQSIQQTSRRRRRQRKRKPLTAWTVLFSGAAVFGATGLAAFLWLTHLPPPPDCQRTSLLASDMDRLYCAREAAQSGRVDDLVASLKLVENWSPKNPLYNEAQDLMADWAEALLAIARRKIYQGDFHGAIETVKQIPKASPNYGDIEAVITDWTAQWKEGEEIYKQAEIALRNYDWDEASDQLSALGQMRYTYWKRQKVDELAQKIVLERQSWQLLNQAQAAAKSNKPEQLGNAIELAQRVNQNTFTWAQAKPKIEQWSKTLLTASAKQREAGAFDQAIAFAQQIPSTASVATEAQNILALSSAQKLAQQGTSSWSPSFGQLWHLSEAIAAAQHVKTNSSLYTEATANVQNWQQELQDVIQLQYANISASVGQHVTLQFAVQQAQQIEANRPRRTQAQTLIAHWKREIERIEDRPIIAQARQLAAPETIPGYQAAIAEARKVKLGRALRLDAQTWIAHWTNQIEIIEDTPILEEAKALASKGSLSRAIDVASKIKDDRALYQEARSAIRRWRYDIWIAQDRKIMGQARALAAELSLTRAIEVASQIDPGRPLYSEARGAIADWKAQRAQIWAEQEAAQDNSSYDDDGYSDEGYSDDSYSDEGYSDDSYSDEESGSYDDGYSEEGYSEESYDEGAY